ncbi:MAG: hypothetical protein J7K36_09730 [Archaeoglobaceae archaeon]|nr:hypothetical protein [Archaeoglobaceae archaeon]
MMTSDKEFVESISGSGTTSIAKVTTRFKKNGLMLWKGLLVHPKLS